MIVQVELKEKCDPFDFRTWNVPVPCGEGRQQIRWLAYAACARMALTTGDVATKFVPQVVKTPEGKILDANKMINEYIQDGSYIVIECSSGPKAFTIDWEGRKHEIETRALSCVADTTTINDWPLYGVEDKVHVKEVLNSYIGFLQALFIWYSCKGQELEDKDFGALNLAQFLQIFQDAMGKEFDGVLLENIFLDFLRINGKEGQYQLSISEFFSVLIHIAPELQKKTQVQPEERDAILDQVVQLIKHYLVPSLSPQLMPYMQDLQAASQRDCLELLNGFKETMELCLKGCKPKSDTVCLEKIPFKMLLPFLRKWFVLGKTWNPQLVAVLLIYAYQKGKKNPESVDELLEFPFDLEFGVRELQKFLLGSAHFCHKESLSPIKISDQAYLREHLNGVFGRAGVAKPLYTTYEEKKKYLRSILMETD